MVDPRLDAAVAAPADDLVRLLTVGVQREDRQADMVGVVDQRLAETRLLGLADERLLLGSGEDRPGDRMIGQCEASVCPATAVGGEHVLAGPHTADDALERVSGVARGEGTGDVRVVDPDRHLVRRHGARHPYLDPCVLSAHLVGTAGQHDDPQRVVMDVAGRALVAGLPVRCGGGRRGAGHDEQRGHGQRRYGRPAVPTGDRFHEALLRRLGTGRMSAGHGPVQPSR
jgi:hypothetical protein